MAESNTTLELLQSHSLHSRRPRPPDLDMEPRYENRVPLRVDSDKLRRRESKLGLGRIFGRQKSTTDLGTISSSSSSSNGGAGALSSLRDVHPRERTGGIRASLAEISNWPYGFHSARSEIILPTNHANGHPSPPPGPASAPVKPSNSSVLGAGGKAKPLPPHPRARALGPGPAPAPRSSRGALATWDPPPLFQAYPQAIRHVELPACTLSAEAILRMHGNKSGASVRDGLSQDLGDATQDKAAEKAKKKHRRNASGSSFKSEWTTKIYVLVTSGYLLQYSGSGSFDRLPEKILHLSKDSAAFASDLIPGRHWVIQVSAAMDQDGTSTADTRSLFSRLPFRGPERRQASLFLMVFESAEEMDHWIAILRREIEHLGGKKSLSETGKPKADDNVLELRAQPSQRTLVLRDPGRFSRVISQDLPWEHHDLSPVTPEPAGPDIHLEMAESDSTPDQSFDDVSTTNSMVSHDGRQLDSLRDNSNRISFISSGQRTIITSEGSSSPACSPVRDSFSSSSRYFLEEPPFHDLHIHQHHPPRPHSAAPMNHLQEAQPRPNAQAISDRRKSMQAMNPMVDVRISAAAPPRPLSTLQPATFATDITHPYPLEAHTIPNFSVPHSVSKRYSLVKSLSLPSEPTPVTTPNNSPPMMSPPANGSMPPPRTFSRRAPPPALAFSGFSGFSSRPLSIVADLPSPQQSPPAGPFEVRMSHHQQSPSMEAPDTPSMFESWGQQVSEPRLPKPRTPPKQMVESPLRATNLQVVVHSSPRRHSSLQTLRSTLSDSRAEQREPDAPRHSFVLPDAVVAATAATGPTKQVERTRSKSSMGSYERARSPLLETSAKHQNQGRRVSMFAHLAEAATFRSPPSSFSNSFTHPRMPPPVPPKTHQPHHQHQHHKAGPSASSQHLRVGSDSKALLNRRSMPQLTDGPPPAPPPTCALPPIPPRMPGAGRTSRSSSIRV